MAKKHTLLFLKYKKRTCIIIALLFLPAFFPFYVTMKADIFSPTPMTLSTADIHEYADGEVEISFLLEGHDATVWLVVYTSGISAPSGYRGNLDYHYVDGIDTLVHLHSGEVFRQGTRTITWDGIDKNGNPVPQGNYRFFLLAVDQTFEGVEAIYLDNGPHRFCEGYIQYKSYDGTPLDAPFLWTIPPAEQGEDGAYSVKISRWRIGLSPDYHTPYHDIQTFKGVGEVTVVGNLSVDDELENVVYFAVSYQDKGFLMKAMLRPGEEAYIFSDFADNGNYEFIVDPNFPSVNSGAVLKDGKIALTSFSYSEDISDVEIIDKHTGELITLYSFYEWFEGDDETENIVSGGPSSAEWSQRYPGCLYLSGEWSCMRILVDTTTDPMKIVWANGNGDYYGDKNYLPGDMNPWGCQSWFTSPMSYNSSEDPYGFVHYPSNLDGPYTAFVLGPDGSGICKYIRRGERGGDSRLYVKLIQGNTVYDGILTSGAEDLYPKHLWMPYASTSGMINWSVGVNDNIMDTSGPSLTVFPNPSNAGTKISYTLDEASPVSISVYNIKGQKVFSRNLGTVHEGTYHIPLNTADMAGGVYLVSLDTGKTTLHSKLIILR